MRYAVSNRTKHDLCAALKSLMAQKPLEKITVRELTDSCGMIRQTFYYHFEDIYDLVRWMFQQEAVALLQKQEGVLLWQEGLLQLFQYIQDNRAVCLCALKSLSRDHLKRFFLEDLHTIIYRTVMDLSQELSFPEARVECELIAQFYVIALCGVMESYLLGELDATPAHLIQFLDNMLQDQIRGATIRLSQPLLAPDTPTTPAETL